ncbi:hypothetical protein D9611_005197 [Ephemerocybe angulata]|uniref:Uncharacterized protein n=1 Tax=Ephemerocybe angulata TaxID=980116 RepID=A0A8H5BZZ2_9AGAR|nr:hypothetical protein D9611_005197 [Tulosesus angulatus]
MAFCPSPQSASSPLRLFPVIFVILVLLQCQVSLASFTSNACWLDTRRCIQRVASGAFCFVPVAKETTTTLCNAASADFQAVLDVHRSQSLSIAYYDGVTNRQLGGTDWAIPPTPGVYRLCASGRAGNGELQTICTNADKDNVFNGNPACLVIGGPETVSDGCYDAVQAAPAATTTTTSTTSATSTSSTTTTTTTSSTSSTSTTTTSEEPSSSKEKESSESPTPSVTTTSTPLPTSTIVVSNTLPAAKVDKVKDVAVPIICSILGVLAALIGAGFWKKHEAQRLQAAQAARRNNLPERLEENLDGVYDAFPRP